MRLNFSKSKNFLLHLFAFLFVVSVALSGYLYWQLQSVKKSGMGATTDESKALIAKVGKLILLPTDEQPTIATVTDPEALKDQTFFANAKTGYKVLVYSVAKKAILYDPVGNRVIEVGPVTVPEEKASTPPKTDSKKTN